MISAVKKASLALALAALGLCAQPAFAFDSPDYVRVTWGVLGESYLDPLLTTAGSDDRTGPFQVNFNMGAGVGIPFSKGSWFGFAPAADFYYYYAAYSADAQPYAVDETFSSAFVLGLLLNMPVVCSFPLGDKFSLALGLGPCFDLRYAITMDSTKAENTTLMNNYFWDQGRYFCPSTSIRGEYKLTDRVGFGFTGRVLWPVYNLWINDSFDFFDQAKYVFDLSIRYKLGNKSVAGAEQASETATPATAPQESSAPTSP
jgi:hypothetical protein